MTPATRRRPCPSAAGGGFTLVELLVSTTVLSILMLLVTQVIGQVQKTWLQSNTRVAQFREARVAFDLITHNLAQAKLNTYWDTDAGGLSEDSNRQTQIPKRYVRKSELQFICGSATTLVQGAPSRDTGHLPYHAVFFQATLGVTQTPDYERLQSLLCGRGYFVQYGDDAAFRPPFVTKATNRFRLMEYSPTAEQNQIYYDEVENKPSGTWFADAGATFNRSSESTSAAGGSVAQTRGLTRPVAENIIALIIAPRISSRQAQANNQDPHWIAPHFTYDSTQVANTNPNNLQGTQHLLPPMVDVVMVAIDEATQDRFGISESSSLQSVAPFTDADRLDLGSVSVNSTDIKSLEDYLVNKKVNFRVFTATVEIRSARWSL